MPLHALLISEMRYLNIQTKNLQESLGGIFENVLDEHGIGSSELFTKNHGSATSYADRLQYKAVKYELQPNKCRQEIKLFDAFQYWQL